jgi:RND family efflux transporter MFP subunit
MNTRACRRTVVVIYLTALALVTCPLAKAEPGAELTIDSVVLRASIEAEVPARHLGVLETTTVVEGATVAEDDVLAGLDDRIALLAVQKAELEREQAAIKANNQLSIQYADKALEVARAEYKRSQDSNEKFPNSISHSQLDVERLTVEKLELEREQAKHELELARFELQVKQNALDAAKLDLQLHAVRAPFAGVVALVRVHVGEWMQPGTPVVRLVGIDVLRAEGFAPAAAANQSLLGAEVQFQLEGEGAPAFDGVIGFISPEIDPVTRQVRIWAAIDNSEHKLRPGQQGQLVIPAERRLTSTP